MSKFAVVFAALLFIPSVCSAQLSRDETLALVKLSRVDVTVMAWGKDIRNMIELQMRGAPTAKFGQVYSDFFQTINLQELYTVVFYELANTLDKSDLAALQPCFENSGTKKYKASVYRTLTKDGDTAFKRQKNAVELGIEAMDVARKEAILESAKSQGDWEAEKSMVEPLLVLFMLELKKVYPMLARTRGQIQEMLDNAGSAPRTDAFYLESTVIRYLHLRDLNDAEFEAFLACERKPEMDKFDRAGLAGTTKYLESLIARQEAVEP